GTGDIDHVDVPRLDDAVEVDVDEIEAGRSSPVAEEARLGVLELEGLAEKRIVEQIDLTDGEVVRGPPPGVHAVKLVVGKSQGVGHAERVEMIPPWIPRMLQNCA